MRVFIVGNGKSLNETPLEKLNGEVSFAVNGITPIYEKTKWRPTHYVRAEEAGTGSDPSKYRKDIETHLSLGCEMWTNKFFVKSMEEAKNYRKWNFIHACSHYGIHFDSPNVPLLYHPPHLCTFGSSVNVAIQIALDKLHADTVYLVGCDLGYGKSNNHFDGNYTDGVGALRDARHTELDILSAHMVAARSYPGRIFNATVGGSLEVYERVNFNDLF